MGKMKTEISRTFCLIYGGFSGVANFSFSFLKFKTKLNVFWQKNSKKIIKIVGKIGGKCYWLRNCGFWIGLIRRYGEVFDLFCI